MRGFHGWLKAGRVVCKGQKGIKVVAPDTIEDGGKVVSSKPVYMFDETQTPALAHRVAANNAPNAASPMNSGSPNAITGSLS